MTILGVNELVQQARQRVRCISAQQALAELDNNRGLLVDVREPAEVAEQPVSASVNVPRGVLEMKIAALCDEGRPIYVHCAAGGRATLAAEQLQRMGYRNVTAVVCPVADLQSAGWLHRAIAPGRPPCG
jgi:phage shock protein E